MKRARRANVTQLTRQLAGRVFLLRGGALQQIECLLGIDSTAVLGVNDGAASVCSSNRSAAKRAIAGAPASRVRELIPKASYHFVADCSSSTDASFATSPLANSQQVSKP
jgi:hypothetical protein